jgi:hypothetical protein
VSDGRRLDAWSDISLSDVAMAYHKAKCDAFGERSTVASQEFAEYEQHLEQNLRDLLARILRGEAEAILAAGSSGYDLVPKKFDWVHPGPHRHTWVQSDAERRFKQLSATHSPTLELRVCGRFSVEAHVIGALWLNLVGHRLDAVLGKCCYGSRLRRYRSQTEPGHPRRDYHIEAHGSFEPYVHPYRRWRGQAMRRIRSELEDGERVLAVMLDLRSYYHRVDPAFVNGDEFIREVERDMPEGERLTGFERAFTATLAASFCRWGSAASGELGMGLRAHWGLPIGSSAARLFANLLLLKWDRAVLEGLTPLFYGRYVDDMIIVLRDPGTLDGPRDLYKLLRARILDAADAPLLDAEEPNGTWHIRLGAGYAAASVLEVHSDKLRTFALEGSSGVDFLDTLDREAREVSSERRLLPNPELLGTSFAARLLTAAEVAGEEADTFRRAGMLSVRRFAWSVNLRQAEILALDLPPDEWTKRRDEFYRFGRAHVVCADKFLNHVDTFGRLVSLAIACGDWKDAARLVAEAHAVLRKLRRVFERAAQPLDGATYKDFCINGDLVPRDATAAGGQLPRDRAWYELRQYLGRVALQALARSWTSAPRPSPRRRGAASPEETLVEKVGGLLDGDYTVDATRAMALSFLRADLARMPVAEALGLTLDPPAVPDAWLALPSKRTSVEFLEAAFGEGDRFRLIMDFVKFAGCRTLTVSNPGADFTSYFFATRPVSAATIARLAPETTVENPCWATFASPRMLPPGWSNWSPTTLWARLLKAIRGVATDSAQAAGHPQSDGPVVELSYKSHQGKPSIALANIHIQDAWWAGAASGKPVLSAERYERLGTLINDVVRARPFTRRPEYLVLPELSVPRRWASSVAKFLNGAGISLVAGVEYGHGDDLTGSTSIATGKVANQSMLSIIDHRLGFPYVTPVWQTKTQPAPGEAELLHRVHGRSWNGGIGASTSAPEAERHPHDPKPIYNHGGMCFGVLVCSELLNARYRVRFQGQVDLLMVLSWNHDLETFNSLIESACLDVHSYVALVNNGRFGDTRLRVPSKKDYERDVCRIRGGKNDYFVVADLNVDALRTFQSRSLSWPRDDDPFKPVPEGFSISRVRRVVPK